MAATSSRAFRAAWIFPVAEPPICNGIIEVDECGDILSVQSAFDSDAIDLGNVALVPALVNAHVHLEFSDISSPLGPANSFPNWVKNVVAHRRNRHESVASILNRGAIEASRTGTIAAGEISTSDDLEAYAAGPIMPTIFRELIGPLPDYWDELLATARTHLESCRNRTDLRGGLSPHAPYTVPQELFERTVELAVQHSAPVAVHLAETTSERDLLGQGRGELVEMMQSLNLWIPELHPQGRRPFDWIRVLARCRRGLVVHGNYLEEDELDLIAASPNLALVYCPRTHAYFEHPPHPFRRLLDRTGRVAIGTDGRSSNPDLNLYCEGRFLRQQYPDLPSDTILHLLTQSGAESLGVSDRFGVLSPGRRADFVAIKLQAPYSNEPPDLFEKHNFIHRVFRGGIAVDSHHPHTPCLD